MILKPVSYLLIAVVSVVWISSSVTILLHPTVGIQHQLISALDVQVQEGVIRQETAEKITVLYESIPLRLTCALGSILGALLVVLVFNTRDGKEMTIRELSAKFLASGIGGVVFTPWLMRWREVTLDIDHVIAYSCCVAVCTTFAMHKLMPVFEGKMGDILEQIKQRVLGK